MVLEDHHHTGHHKSGSKPHWPSVCLWFVIYRTDLLGLIYHKYDLVTITMSELPSVFVFAQCHTFASWLRSCCARQSCSACVDYRGQFPWRQPRSRAMVSAIRPLGCDLTSQVIFGNLSKWPDSKSDFFLEHLKIHLKLPLRSHIGYYFMVAIIPNEFPYFSWLNYLNCHIQDILRSSPHISPNFPELAPSRSKGSRTAVRNEALNRASVGRSWRSTYDMQTYLYIYIYILYVINQAINQSIKSNQIKSSNIYNYIYTHTRIYNYIWLYIYDIIWLYMSIFMHISF